MKDPFKEIGQKHFFADHKMDEDQRMLDDQSARNSNENA